VQIDYRWCSTCDGKQLFEQPPCEDGHGDDCLDLACVTCGSALVLGLVDTPATDGEAIRVA
jgi:hypothetical protein